MPYSAVLRALMPRVSDLKIVVCLKSVPGFVTRYQVAKTHDKIDYESGSIIINEADDYALEEALVLKKALGASITVMTLGTVSAQQALYTGLAKGADRAIRISADLNDSASISSVLAAAIKTVDHDLVFTGMESSDNMAGQVGGSVAERLDLPFACGVVEVKYGECPGTVRVTKEVGGGIKQILEMSMPAVLSIQSGIVHLNFVPFRRLAEARAKPVETLTLEALHISEEDLKETRRFRILEVHPPPKQSGAEIMEGQPADMARMLSEKIRDALR